MRLFSFSWLWSWLLSAEGVLCCGGVQPLGQVGRRFGSAQGVRAELERVEADACDPLADEAGVLTCREATTVAATGE